MKRTPTSSFVPGGTAWIDGYFATVADIVGRTAPEIETAIGYRKGSLGKGYWFCTLDEAVDDDDFEHMGITRFLDGIYHERHSFHEFAEDYYGSRPDISAEWPALLRDLAGDFRRNGPSRGCKVVSLSEPGYVTGDKTLQYRLKRTKRFVTHFVVAPEQRVRRVPARDRDSFEVES